nr:copia protein [Tanacetum cinerariifolium]
IYKVWKIPVSAAKPKAAASTSAAKNVNTAGPKHSVNFSNSRSTFHKSHSTITRSFYNATTHSRSNSTERVNTVGSKAVSVVKGNEVTAVKASAKNKAYLADYQEIHDGGFDAFGSSRGKITGIVTDDFSRFSWVFFLATEDETSKNTLDPLGKFKGKADEGFLVGYSVTSKAFGVFNTKTRKVEENLHVRFLENKPNVAGKGPNWLFDIDSLTNSMNYIPVFAGNQTNKNEGPQDTNGNACTQDYVDVEKEVSDQHHIMLTLWSSISFTYKISYDKTEDNKPKDDTGSKTVVKPVNKEDQAYKDEFDRQLSQEKGAAKAGSTNSFNTVSNPVNAANDTIELRSTGIFTSAYDDDLDTFNSPFQSVGIEADFNNMESSTIVSPITTHMVHIDHPKDQILEDSQSAVQTRGMAKKSYGAHAFAYRNKKDERGIEVRNKARLVAQGHRKEEGIDYDEVFAHVAKIKAIRIFLAFASFIGFIVYQMDVKSAFLYGKIEEEVYFSQPPGFIDP